MNNEKSPFGITIALYLLVLFFPVTFYIAGLVMQDTVADGKAMKEIGVIDGSLRSLQASSYQNTNADMIVIIDSAMEYIGSEFIQKSSNQMDMKRHNPELVYQDLLESWQKMKKMLLLNTVPQKRVADKVFKRTQRLAMIVQGISDAKQQNILYLLYAALTVSMILVILLVYFMKRHLKKQAEHGTLKDHVTKFYNKKYFLDEMNNATARAKRANEMLSLVFFSIDDFEKYRLGTRDELIVSLGRLLLPMTRSSDILCRVAENEYAIIAPKTEAQKVQILIERIRKTVQGALSAGKQSATISSGIVQYQYDEDVSVCIRRAEKLMYEARTYRNKVMIAK